MLNQDIVHNGQSRRSWHFACLCCWTYFIKKFLQLKFWNYLKFKWSISSNFFLQKEGENCLLSKLLTFFISPFWKTLHFLIWGVNSTVCQLNWHNFCFRSQTQQKKVIYSLMMHCTMPPPSIWNCVICKHLIARWKTD